MFKTTKFSIDFFQPGPAFAKALGLYVSNAYLLMLKLMEGIQLIKIMHVY